MIGRIDFLNNLISQFINRRQELGLTQEKVDALMGNADRLVSKWECGDRTPSSFNLFCWAQVLKGEIILDPKE